ncbi:OmpH family outer membrane protein [Salinisphaera sp.]|uniref:OmpH family outer membrane protein n=1 Tax=Salinisphaera sp. TaxID=1914330 RepID=UPI002D766818|nr:OmpH family outer membrane protein [Salinisphaera sp.]HET7313680.1 OmpH family outer membrane protein [Salinisphaera sp.]
MKALSRTPFWLAALALATVLAVVLAPTAAEAQPTRPPPIIGVVDLDRLISESPQAKKARQNMAERFAKRKNALEKASDALQSEVDRLKKHSETMSDEARDRLVSKIRDDKNQLQLKQAQYNGDVSDAEQKELDHMRSNLRQVIDRYAKQNGYDLIVGDSVLYASDTVNITDAILNRLQQQAAADDPSAKPPDSDKSD